MPLREFTIIYCTWWMMWGNGVAVRAGWYSECMIITSLWCGSHTVKETLRSLSNGPWPLDAGKSAFQVKSAPAWGGLLTLSHGETVYAVTQGEWKHRATGSTTLWTLSGKVMLRKRAGEWFYPSINLQIHIHAEARFVLISDSHCRAWQGLPDTLIIYYTTLSLPPLKTFRKYFCIIFANMSFVDRACALLLL